MTNVPPWWGTAIEEEAVQVWGQENLGTLGTFHSIFAMNLKLLLKNKKLIKFFKSTTIFVPENLDWVKITPTKENYNRNCYNL